MSSPLPSPATPPHAASGPVIRIHGAEDEPEFLTQLLTAPWMADVRLDVVPVSTLPNAGNSVPQAREEAALHLLIINEATLRVLAKPGLQLEELANKAAGEVILILREDLPERLPAELVRHPQCDFTTADQFTSGALRLTHLIEKQLSVGNPRLLRLRDEAGRRVYEYLATSALLRVLALTARLNRARGEKLDLSFGAVLHAFTLAHDPVSWWFAEYVQEAALTEGLPRVLSGPAIDAAMFDQARRSPLSAQEPATTSWLQDAALFCFFQAEGRHPHIDERLSRATGKGLW